MKHMFLRLPYVRLYTVAFRCYKNILHLPEMLRKFYFDCYHAMCIAKNIYVMFLICLRLFPLFPQKIHNKGYLTPDIQLFRIIVLCWSNGNLIYKKSSLPHPSERWQVVSVLGIENLSPLPINVNSKTTKPFTLSKFTSCLHRT
jgi:hypothetical protein